MSLLLPGVVMVVGTHTGHRTPPGEGATAMPSGLEPLICVRFELGIVCSSRADQRWFFLLVQLGWGWGVGGRDLRIHPWRCGRQLLSQDCPVCL